jgi:hypothetical protein
MSWFSDFKAKRAAKKAQALYQVEHAAWVEDCATLDKIITVITAARDGEDSVPNTLMQAPGEHTLWSATGIFHETDRTPSRYVGGSTGASFPIAGGVRFKVGAQRGTIVSGTEMQMDKDQGVVMLTNERLIFTGPVKSQEWKFDKLLMLSTSDDESDYYISVSNRKTNSGVRFSPTTGREFNRFLGAATAVNEHGYEKVLDELESLKKKALAEEPQLELPSTHPAIEAQ